MNKEIWIDLPKYEGLYKISNLGNVKRLSHYITRKINGTFLKKERTINFHKIKKGYLRVTLYNGKTKSNFLVHRLVAKSFLGDFDGKQVNHINGVKYDNRLENLEWVTQNENMKHAVLLGLVKQGSLSPLSKKVLCINLKNNEKIEFGSIREAKEYLGINSNNSHISSICRGKRKSTKGYTFKYI